VSIIFYLKFAILDAFYLKINASLFISQLKIISQNFDKIFNKSKLNQAASFSKAKLICNVKDETIIITI